MPLLYASPQSKRLPSQEILLVARHGFLVVLPSSSTCEDVLDRVERRAQEQPNREAFRAAVASHVSR